MNKQDDNGMAFIDKNNAIWFEMLMHTAYYVVYSFLEVVVYNA